MLHCALFQMFAQCYDAAQNEKKDLKKQALN